MLTFRLLTLMYTKVCFKIINTRTFNKVWKNIPILNNPLWEKLFLKQLTFNHRKQYFYQIFLRKIYHVHNLQLCSQSLFTILKVLISNKVSSHTVLGKPYGRVPISSIRLRNFLWSLDFLKFIDGAPTAVGSNRWPKLDTVPYSKWGLIRQV